MVGAEHILRSYCSDMYEIPGRRSFSAFCSSGNLGGNDRACSLCRLAGFYDLTEGLLNRSGAVDVLEQSCLTARKTDGTSSCTSWLLHIVKTSRTGTDIIADSQNDIRIPLVNH